MRAGEVLIGRDLPHFPDGKTNLTEAEIQKVYPHPFKIVGQSEIEKAFAEHNKAYCAIVPAVRWSPTGYPELLLFYVVDAADAVSIISFASERSTSNPPITPSAPSSHPPAGTESRCDPTTTVSVERPLK